MLGFVSKWLWQKLRLKYYIPLELGGPPSKNCPLSLIANEPAERRRSAGEAAENSAARRMLYAEKFSNDV